MAKAKQDPIRSVSFGVRQSHIDFIERAGVGDNSAEKLRSVLDRCSDMLDTMVRYDKNGEVHIVNHKAVLIFEKTPEGTKEWNDSLPFPLVKKEGVQGIKDSAKKAGWVVQVEENKDTGFLAVWAAPADRLRNCDECKKRVVEVMGI